MNEATYTDTTDLEGTGEPIDELDSEEIPRQTFTPTTPGTYTSNQRILVPKGEEVIRKQEDGNYGLLLKLVGGIQDGEGGFHDTKYPHSVYSSTMPKEVLDFSVRPPKPRLKPDGTALKVSDVNRYLRLAGLDPKGLRVSDGTLLAAVEQTLDVPVGVRVGWRERTTKGEDGKYPKSVLRTKDFQVGVAPDGTPVYSPEVWGVLEERTSQKGRPYKVFVKKSEAEGGRLFKASAFVEYFTDVPKAR